MGDLPISETVRETRVEGKGDDLYTVTHLYTRPKPGFPGVLLCQLHGRHSHENIYAEFVRQNNQ